MNTATILDLVTTREATATTPADELRDKIGALTAELPTVEAELDDLQVKRQTLRKLTHGELTAADPAITSSPYQQILAVFDPTSPDMRAKDVSHALGLGVAPEDTAPNSNAGPRTASVRTRDNGFRDSRKLTAKAKVTLVNERESGGDQARRGMLGARRGREPPGTLQLSVALSCLWGLRPQPVSWPHTHATKGLNSTVVTNTADSLTTWLHGETPSRRRGAPALPAAVPTGRFAFYGRVSTRDNQEERSSRQWQYENAERVILEAGTIVRSFFDAGYSRSLPWTARPQARALLDAVADPHRDFDAIIVGEYERGFSGGQLLELMPYFQRHDVALWLPELNGPVDPADPTHRALVMMLGHQSQREVLRARFRTRSSMRIQVRDHGRYIGGRPPYGYQIVDAGPHPNRRHARWGRRQLQLVLNPDTARHVRWIFARRLAGDSVATITLRLNERRIPCPSEYDRARNAHRGVRGWSPRTVSTILENPRYTGRQVWNRSSTDHQETRPGDKYTTNRPVRRPNPKDEWIVSTGLAHPAMISEEEFVAAQKISALPTPREGPAREYLLTGLVLCDNCGRRAEAQWAYNRAGYRCRHGRRGPRSMDGDRPLHVREDRLLAAIAVQLDIRTGEGQTLWPDTDISAYLHAHHLTVRCTRDAVVIDGMPPKSNETASGEQLAPAVGNDQHDAVEQQTPPKKRHKKAAPRHFRKRRTTRRTIAERRYP